MIMPQTLQFGQVVDAAENLTADEKEELIDILRRRLAEEGRKRIALDIEEARREFAAGGRSEPTSVDDLMREITS
jgi:hypothetical protein